jgi:pimeloyl-ACP methyl ester carboxylesterase
MVRNEIVEGIPVILARPPAPSAGIVLWLSYLGGSAEQTLPTLERFAAAGHAAVSFDAPGHGARGGGGDPREVAREVLGAFRRKMWPLLGATTLESLRVLDWAAAEVPTDGPVLVGGLSMGGDIAIALAGIDPRVRRVVGVGSTPDWSRPGMCQFGDPSSPIDQGEADSYAQWFADRLDPMRHLDRYLAGTEIGFELGADDCHIPAANARDFAAALAAIDPEAEARVRIRMNPGLGHSVIADPAAVESACDWLLAGGPGG